MFKIGDTLEEFKAGKDVFAIAVMEENIIMYLGYKNPREDELLAIKHSRLDLHLMKKKDAIIFSFKSFRGKEVDYFETYYNPNITPPLRFSHFKKSGFPLIFIILDTDTGKILGMRFQVMSADVSNQLVDMIHEEQRKFFTFNPWQYYKNTNDVMKKFNSKELFEQNGDISCIFESGILADNVVFLNDIMDDENESKE